MNLVIVESPTKSKTISRYLGPKYKVFSSYGHIRDLPKSELGIDIENNFKPKYIIPTKSRKTITLLKKESEKAETVILACDQDREGEAIAWHLVQALGLNEKQISKEKKDFGLDRKTQKYQRIVFHEITKQAIKKALKNPRKININLVNAQQARRILDRIVGYKLSPFLWKKVARGLSAGRVQSVAVRLVVEREKEIESFILQEYWIIEAKLQSQEANAKNEFLAKLIKKDGKTISKLGIKTKKEADEIIKNLKKAEYKIANIEKKEIRRNPLPPFTTSTLQQTAWQKFKWPAKQTMRIGQQLYEKGLCVDGNSLIVTKEGEIYRIKELENSRVNTLIGIGETTLQPEFAKISKFWKIKAPRKIIEIETKDYEKILITKDHPLLLLRNGLSTWVKGENIQKGDYVAALEMIPVTRRKRSSHLIELVQYLPKGIQEKVVFKFSPQFFSFIRQKEKKKFVPYHVIERLWREKRMKIEKIEKYYQGIKVKPPVGNSKFHKIPFYLTPELGYLAGLITSDGHLVPKDPKINIANQPESKSSFKELNKLVEKILGMKFNRFIPQRKQTPINSTFLYHLLPLFGIPTGNKAKRINISNILLSQPDKILKTYIAGLWDGDGCINKHPTANSIQISYSSKSELFIDKLRLVLKTFGMNSSKHLDKRNKVYWIRLTSNAIPKFKEYIAPHLIIKKEKWEKLYKKYHRLYENRVISQCQQVPGITSLLESLLLKYNFPKKRLSTFVGVDLFNYFGTIDSTHTRLPFIQKPILERISTFVDTKNKLFERLGASPIIWKEIKKIREINYKKPFVYDLTTSTNTFITNGLVSHNCTYHRTDSLNISNLALNTAKKFIEKNYGQNYYQFRKYKTKTKAAQEAHEAIRPTYPHKAPNGLKIDNQQKKLYDLIWRRFIACQMSQARFDSTTIDIEAEKNIFRATGQVLKFDGFLKIYPLLYKEAEFPLLKKGQILKLLKLIPSQHFTQPPPRYNEASLIKVLEENGIGRPSTYAPILSTIQERNYIQKDEKKRLLPTEIGGVVNDILVNHFPTVVDIGFTAKMEEKLDKIAAGEKEWVLIIKKFYMPFEENLKEKEKEVSKETLIEKTNKICPRCGSPIIIRLGKFGKFYACSGFPKCKYTEPLKRETLGIKCPQCKGGEIIEKRTRKGKIFYGCNKWPECDFALWDKPTGEKCPQCNSLLITTKRKQIRCSNKECNYKK